MQVAHHGSIEVELHSDTAAIVTLHGEHDMESGTEVAVGLASAGERQNVLVDLSDSTFIDSSVIGALLRAAKQARGRDGVLAIVIPPDVRAVRRALEVSGVEALLTLHATRAEGLSALDDRARKARQGLQRVNAEIEQIQARTASGQAWPSVTDTGVTVMRAHVVTDAVDDARHYPG